MASEFALIEKYFTRAPSPQSKPVLGVGDDAALLQPSAGKQLAISTDMLGEGTHFLPDTPPQDLGWKTLAVNLSDLAAMGAQPRWALLAAALPDADEEWIAAFAEGFFACAETFGVTVIGGDTIRGPRNFSVTIIGEVEPNKALLRSGGKRGDDIWVSGSPGLAALGLAHLQGRCKLSEPWRSRCLEALQRPQPRVALGLALTDMAHAAIDVSDGLLADLAHLAKASGLDAEINISLLPPAAMQALADDSSPDAIKERLAEEAILAGGDDYELLFTAVPANRQQIEALGQQLKLSLTRIGSLQPALAAPGVTRLVDRGGQNLALPKQGFDHFAN